MTKRTRNILLYGPPGTGKTWLVTQFAKAFTEAEKVEMVTFHQSFAYEEFVEGVKPVIHEGQVSYAVVDGVFKRACRTAEKNPDSQYLLIIDEINRANIAKVLGELITLIEDDKRLGQANEVQVTLPYSGERFGVPPNLTLLGTMNTADRSIALLDLALRRRFTFVEMPPDPSLLSANVAGVNLQALLTRLNKRVGALLDPDHRIGHSYLMGVETEADLHFAWYRRIVPLLQEYFYHDGERLQAVLGKAFVMETALDVETKDALGDAYEEIARYEVRELAGEEFLAALQVLAGGA
jgi:5-methylcytosine-specific restriction protein B